MERKLSKNNSGYSLVELLIVIAIIVVLASAAMLSYTMIHSARAKDAAIKLNSEVNELKSRCMNMKPETAGHTYYALSLYTVDNTPHLCMVEFNSASNKYVYVEDTDINLSSSVKVDFDGTLCLENSTAGIDKTNYVPGGRSGSDATTTPVYICFDKRGNCYSGYGVYDFSKINGNVVSHVNIGMNGSISVR